RALASAYEGIETGRAPRVPDTNIYERYLRWWRSFDRSETRAYWRAKMHDLEQATPIPKVAGRQAGVTPEFGRYTLDLEPAFVKKMESLAEDVRVTPATLLDAAWAMLLLRSSGAEDVVFGMTVSGRDVDIPGVETVVGHFIYFLPLRISVGEIGPAWLRHVQSARMDAIAHQHIDLAEIQGYSAVPGDHELFQSFVVFENYPLELTAFRNVGLEATLKAGAGNMAHYPLAIGAMPKGDRLDLFFNFDRTLFDDTTVADIANELRGILGEIVELTTG
ncbi:MAG: condensation domain-containing protein, partial [Nannocystaceae bacterium]